jgi:hypothetical protein
MPPPMVPIITRHTIRPGVVFLIQALTFTVLYFP